MTHQNQALRDNDTMTEPEYFCHIHYVPLKSDYPDTATHPKLSLLLEHHVTQCCLSTRCLNYIA